MAISYHCIGTVQRVASLKKDGIAYSDSSKKAEVISDQFSSVFAKEDSPPLSDITGTGPYPEMLPIRVHAHEVAELLKRLSPQKAAGLESRPSASSHIKEVADEIAPEAS